MHERDLPSNIPTLHYFTGERRLQQIYTVRQPLEGKTCFITCVFIYIIYRFYTTLFDWCYRIITNKNKQKNTEAIL
jgi:hypothetical protein